jgi:phospholipid/cholesterol/gamma-HCH transport system permease protein
MIRVGVRAVPIVSLVLLFVGLVLAFQMDYVLRTFGQKHWIADVVAVAMLRELAPLLTGVVMSGFAGASIAAELGTMVVGEEILALESQALDPMKFLVMPRVVATTLMQVCLTMIANVVGILGGFIVTTSVLGENPYNYIQRTITSLQTQDLLTGLTKAAAFGVLISLIACYLGLRVTAGAEGVGRATTRSVVYAIVAIIVTDLVFSAFFSRVL